ncbi:MAG: hypothetical protein ACFFCD_07840 [Promethearchaeota archaeon]
MKSEKEKEKTVSEVDENKESIVSDYLVGLIDMVFAVAIGVSITLVFEENIFLQPSLQIIITTFLSLMAAYTAVVLSWIFYHRMIIDNHYRLDTTLWAYIRFAIDFVIVFIYIFLTLLIAGVYSAIEFSMFLINFPIIFVLYALGGFIRDLEYKKSVSFPGLSLMFAGLFAVNWFINFYYSIVMATSLMLQQYYLFIQWGLLILTTAYLIVYRLKRKWRELMARSMKRKKNLKIGVDVDGVLGDQIPPILKKLNKRYGLKLSKEDVTLWDLPIKDTDIETEIESALFNEDYILNMQPIDGAKEAMTYLSKMYFVKIITSRPKETEAATLKWLRSNFDFDEYLGTQKRDRVVSFVNVDILIDDNLPSTEKFSRSGGKTGILFSQPWNQERSSIKDLIDSGKVKCCNGWEEVLDVIKSIES